MSETDLQRAIMTTLSQLGCVVQVTRVQSGRVKVRGGWMHLAPEGTPDLHVMLTRGRALWIETKTPFGKLSATQVAWHVMCALGGHRVACARNIGDACAAVWLEVQR